MNRTVNTQNISPERENCMEKLMSGGLHGKQNQEDINGPKSEYSEHQS